MDLLKAKINLGYLLIALYAIFALLVFASQFLNGTFLRTFALYSGYFVIPLFVLVGSFVPGDQTVQAISGSLVILLLLIVLRAIIQHVVKAAGHIK